LSTSLSNSASGSRSTAAASPPRLPPSSSLTKRRQRTTDDLLHWRRYQVVKFLSQGFTIDQTAEKLQVSPKTVQRDYAYIRQHASQVIRNDLQDTLPNEMLKALARLNAVSNAAWAMYARAIEKGDDKLEVVALRLAKDIAIEIVNLLTDNHSFVDAAFEVAAAYDQDGQKQQQLRRQMNNSKESQEGHERQKEPIV
jgi:hypothetical protein